MASSPAPFRSSTLTFPVVPRKTRLVIFRPLLAPLP